MSVTAIVLSAADYSRQWPGLETLVVRSVIQDAAQLQAARFDAVARVSTPHFFFLDDDDDLPENYAEVLRHCVALGVPLAYTDEEVNGERRCAGPYSRKAHYENPLLVHHLALYETKAAQEAVKHLPRGHYCPEFMLAWEVARDGACYVPRIGYRWNKTPTGMHTWPSTTLSWARAQLWAKENP